MGNYAFAIMNVDQNMLADNISWWFNRYTWKYVNYVKITLGVKAYNSKWNLIVKNKLNNEYSNEKDQHGIV